MRLRTQLLILLTLSIPWSAGCRRDPADGDRAVPTAAAAHSPPITNRVDIPDTVRRNLGLTFAKVESRPVARMIRVPGRFELLPDARREYRTMLAGRVEVLVRQFQRVEPGQLLYRLDSPPWRELQQKLAEAEAHIRDGEKRVEMIAPMFEANERRRNAVAETVNLFTLRAQRLEKGQAEGGVSAGEIGQVQAQLAQARAELAQVLEEETELAVRRTEAAAQVASARVRFELLLNNAASILELEPDRLRAPSGPEPSAPPVWRATQHVDVVAIAPGFVDAIALSNGGWADVTSLVLSTVQPDQIRFHAHAMQSDIGRFQADLPARIVPPKSSSIDVQETMEGRLELGLSADPEGRTLDLYLTPDRLSPWARPGVTGHLEVVIAGGTPELAIPVSAVIQDGLSKVIFRRDPNNPDKVIRITDADLGADDGRWIVINSGVREGDEVVLDGVYQLMVATSGSIQKGGHFHADGTFHEGDE